jgi:4-hydroxybenzoyl-CoA thioesterase
MNYTKSIAVEFNHCDPAGIVFYPRYFEMLNSVVENFFADVVGVSFATMHLKMASGVPTVTLAADFVAPSRLGDKLIFMLDIEKIGRTSLSLQIEGKCEGEKRLSVRLTVVWVEKGKAKGWPNGMRQNLEKFAGG